MTTTKRAWVQFVTRLHFYIGLFIGPFIFIAAITGTLYVLTPQIEQHLYRDILFVTPGGTPHTLAEQITAAQHNVDPSFRLSAVRTAPAPDRTTRIMFAHANLNASESRAIFINPYTLAVTGDQTVYGTSGILPFRTTLDYLHRSLLLGDIGRNYSEIAASWLWVATLLGITLWLIQRKQQRQPAQKHHHYLRLRRWHTTVGLSIAIGLLFLSATGLTWSRWAGDNIGDLRTKLNWVTPSVSTQLSTEASHAPTPAEHHEHHAMTSSSSMQIHPEDADKAEQAARHAGLQAQAIEIVPPASAQRAWVVREIDRSWPTQVDSVAIHPVTFMVTSQANFSDYPFVAKLIRWGVDLHMGVLFGIVNQLIMAGFGIALSVLIVFGYVMWWKKQTRQTHHVPLIQAWQALPLSGQIVLILLWLSLGVFLPMIGITLCAFVLIDLLRSQWTANHAGLK